MRDHRRRTEIRLIVLSEIAARVASIVAVGRGAFLRAGSENSRLAAAYQVERFAYFSQLPKEFRDSNPAVPWDLLHTLLGHHFGGGPTAGRRTLSNVALWKLASKDIPRISRQLSVPKMPLKWKRESGGHLGISDVLGPHRAAILRVLRRHAVSRLRVYGSVSRGEADGRSDVDLLVYWRRDNGSNDTLRLADDLGAILHRHVQVFTEERTYWAIRDRVLAEAIDFV